MKRFLFLIISVFVFFAVEDVSAQPTVRSRKQGFSMRMQTDNRGVLGIQAYPGGSGAVPAESLGLEYPIGARVEHLFGGGLWIGGLLDTSRTDTSTPLRLVTTSYEGWAGPPPGLVETFPGSTPADTIWRANRIDQAIPPGWVQYWGGSLPYRPISDNDLYCTYTDTARALTGHIPLRLKIIQSSYAWNDPYADAIIIFEYRIINMGRKPIDSAYVGYFFESDDGPIDVPLYFQHNFTAYIANSRTAYVHNPQDAGSTPVGATLLATSLPLDSLRYTFQWFPGPQTPAPDGPKYTLMSSGQIKQDEYPSLSDTRFLFSFGPFTIKPITDPRPDTLKIAVAVISGFSRRIDHRIVLQNNAARALDIYLNQGIRLPATPPSPPLRVTVGFRRIELDWQWEPNLVINGKPWILPDPELNWDTTNQVARRYADRVSRHPSYPLGFDTTRGGRNFEAYRLWRSEVPKDPADIPDQSFTLLKQFDVPTDSFEYNTGLQYTFVDTNLVRGKTYVYAVTSLSIPNLAYQSIQIRDTTGGRDTIVNVTVEVPVDPLESAKRINAVRIDLPFAVTKELGKVSVVPNPYRTDRDYTVESGGYEGLSAGWNENKRVIKFINLPERCTIRIFSLAGDLIRTIEHDGRAVSAGGFPRGDATVPLLSESNRALASGIYIFTVESEFGVQTGKFVIIR